MSAISEGSSSRLDWERVATNLRVEQALLEVLDVLGDLPVVVFKGGILTRRIYGDLRSRASADNDLLVRRRDGRHALTRLFAAGYRAAPGLDAGRALERGGQVTLFRDPDGLEPALDLHVEAFSRNFFRAREEFVWSRLESVQLHQRSILTFDPALTLAHMAAHFVQHLLDVEHLPHLGRAWDAWGAALPWRDVAFVASRTSGLEALEYSLGLAERLGHVQAGPCPLTTARARLGLRLFGSSFLARGPRGSLRGLGAVLVAGPGRLPRALYRGFLPEKDELATLYGEGSHLELLARHWAHRSRD